MREHRPLNTVTDCIDTGDTGLKAVVHWDASAFVEFNSNPFEAQILRVRPSTNANKNHITIELKNDNNYLKIHLGYA